MGEILNEPAASAQEIERVKPSPRRLIWPSRLVELLRWRAYWLMPNTVPPPHGNDKAYREQRDRESNEESRVPNGEELRLRIVWGVEVYGPSEVEHLYERLRRLNWSAGMGRRKEEGAFNWVRRQRAYGGAGAWYNVGHVVVRDDPKRMSMVDNHAPLPEGVDHLQVRIFQLTPSLTSVVVGFVLKESVERVYENELKQDRRTTRERSEHRWSVSIIDPEQLKLRSVEQARERMLDMARNWFSANLAGFFCGLPRDRMPTAELITTKVSHLVPEANERGEQPHWCRLLSNPGFFSVWSSEDCSSLRFVTDGGKWTRETSHLTATLCISKMLDAGIELWGGHGRDAYVLYSHEKMVGILNNYAGLLFLKEESRELKASRAALAIGSVGRSRTVHALEKIQSFFDRSIGTPAVAAELKDRSKDLSIYKHECACFCSTGLCTEEVLPDFGAVLCQQTQVLAVRVLGEEHALREHFEQLSAVLSVRESVRAQKRMEWLTIVAIFVAAASLYAALPPVKDWSGSVKSWLMSTRTES